MQLNLTKWLKLPRPTANSLLLSANEECAALLQSVRRICQARMPEFNQRLIFNADRFFKLAELQNVLENVSLFADKTFIELNFKTKPSQEQQRALLELWPLLDGNNFLVISCDKLDSQDLAAGWAGQLAKSGDLLILNGDYQDSRVWSEYLAAELGLQFEPEALDLILSMNQSNFSQLYQEIHKLGLLFETPATITLSDARINLVDNAQYNIFALSSAYLNGDSLAARKILRTICQVSEETVLISWTLAEDLRRLIRIKNNLRRQPNFSSAIANLRIWGDSVAAFSQANQRLSYSQLLDYFAKLAQIDLQLKGVVKGDALTSLEQLIVCICQGR